VKLTAALIAHELRFQRRSLRCRAFVATYLVLGCLPPLLVYMRREGLDYFIGAATYAGETLGPLPLLTALLAGLLALDGINRERAGGAWTTATLAGVSNAGYLLRRWMALLALILPLSAVPPAVAALLAMAAGTTGIVPATFYGPWLLHVAPLAVAVSALALGLGTIGGNAVSTFLLAILACGVLPEVGNRVLEVFRLRFESPLEWLDLRAARGAAVRPLEALGKDRWRWSFPLPATEAGFDFPSEGEQDLAQALLLAGLAAASLGGAVLYLRRTRPDVRPQRVRPDHPLRNFLISLGRLRVQYTPDPAPAPADVAILVLAALMAGGAVAAEVGRARGYEALAADRWQAEKFGRQAPTSPDVVPESWRVEGSIDRAGRVDLWTTGTLRNAGSRPQGHLAFSLDPSLEIAGLTASQGRLTAHRSWDRLTLDLVPAIPPGGRRTLRFRIAGRPVEADFALPLWRSTGSASFEYSYGRHHAARFSHDRADLSQSYRVPAVSGYRVRLAASALTPVPRYTPWSLDDNGDVVPEAVLPQAQVEVAIAVPRNLLVADSCGGLSDPGARAGRLDSRCVLPLPELTVAGGRQRLLSGGGGGGGTAVAVFPGHRAAGELHLGFLARGTRLVEEAWPGLGGLGRMVVFEWPDEQVHDRNRASYLYLRWRDPYDSFVKVNGNLVFLDETDLIGTRALPPEPMVAEIVAARLARRRRLEPDESLFFRQLFRGLALQRLGLGPQGGAVVGPLELARLPGVHAPALHPESYGYWTDRFPALLMALSRRAGAEPLRASLEELLARGGDKPATFAEWAAIFERRSERPVEPMLRDFFLHGFLPEPTLEDVQFASAAAGWRVTGKVHNEADGEALCRVVLTTDLGPVETTVRTAAGETAPFVLATSNRPQGVFLDPDRECHRLMRTGIRDRVFFQGGRR